MRDGLPIFERPRTASPWAPTKLCDCPQYLVEAHAICVSVQGPPRLGRPHDCMDAHKIRGRPNSCVVAHNFVATHIIT